jgi:hypothetical protein
MERIMGGSGSAVSAMGVKPIAGNTKTGFKKVSNTEISGGGRSTYEPPQKSAAELAWGNNGEDEYDPAYPTPV